MVLRRTFGVNFDANAQWVVDNPLAPGGKDPWVWGSKKAPLAPLDSSFRFTNPWITTSATGDVEEWEIQHDYFVRAPAEDLIDPVLAYYGSGYTNEAYYAMAFPNDPEKGFLFLTHGFNRQGIAMVERQHLLDKMHELDLADLVDDGFAYQTLEAFLATTQQNGGALHHVLSEVHWPLHLLGGTPSGGWDYEFRARITHAPRVAQIGSRWVLAVPGFANLVESGYTPPGGLGEFEFHNQHLFVRFYDISNPDDPQDLPTLFGPSVPTGTTEASAIQAEMIQVQDAANPSVRAWYAVVVDFAGKVLFYDITPIGDVAHFSGLNEHLNKLNDGSPIAENPLASFTIPKSVSDELQPNAYCAVVDQTVDGYGRPRTIVYLSGYRPGIQILEFDPYDRFDGAGQFAGDGYPLHHRGEIQTTHSAYRMWMRGSGANRKLIVADAEAGIRVYEVGQ